MLTQSASTLTSELSKRGRLVATIVILLAAAMDLLDTTIVNIAIPTIQHSLHAGFSLIQWLLVGYTLTFAVTLISGGRLGDIFGYKKLFMIGVSGFGLMSVLCGLAPNIETLVAFRILQGACAALMVPQATSLIQLLYKPKERGTVMGLFGAIGGLSAILGPLIGGALLHANVANLGWRMLFFVNLPVALAALVAARYLLPGGKSPHPLRLDSVGTILITIALTFLVLPLIQGRDLHWPLWTFAMLLASVPFFIVFLVWERHRNKQAHASLIEFSLFKQATFKHGLLLNALFEIILGGLLLAFTLVLQQGLGLSALQAALATIPMIIGIVIGVAILGEPLIPKLGRYVVTLGGFVLVVGMLATAIVFHHYGMTVHAWQFAPSIFVQGIGMGLVTGPLFAITLQHVDSAHAGSASGILESVEQLGSVFGVVLLGGLFFGNITHGYEQAFTWVVYGGVTCALAMLGMSFLLPRHFKSEEELGIDH